MTAATSPVTVRRTSRRDASAFSCCAISAAFSARSRSACADEISASRCCSALARALSACSLASMKSRCRSVGSGASFGRRASHALASATSLPDSSRFGGRPPAAPLGCAHEQPRVLAYPADVGVQGRDEPGEAHPEAGARRLGLAIEVDVVEILKLRRRRATLQLAANDGEDALRKAHGLLHFPAADRGRCRGAREHEGDGVGLADQIAELLLPRLATGDACAVDQRLESAQDEPGDELVRKRCATSSLAKSARSGCTPGWRCRRSRSCSSAASSNGPAGTPTGRSSASRLRGRCC
jgi:hypothetical protein